MKQREIMMRCLRAFGWGIFIAMICMPNAAPQNPSSQIIENFINIIGREMQKSMNDSVQEHPTTTQPVKPTGEVSLPANQPTNQPFLRFDSLGPDLALARIGDTVNIKGGYTAVNGRAVNGGAPLIKGTLSLSFGGKPLGEPTDLGLSQEGQVQFEKKLTIKPGLKDGKYDAVVKIDYCGKTVSMNCSFSIGK